jgi:hypothetical protein
MDNPNLKLTLDGMLMVLQDRVASMKKCDDEHFPIYIQGVTDELIDQLIAEQEEVRSYLPIDDSNT